MMGYTQLGAVVGALLLATGLSAGPAPEPEEAVTVEIDTVTKLTTKPDWLSASTEEARVCISTESTIETANTDDPDIDDPCGECWLDCWEEFRECRYDCGGNLACIENCVDEEIACEQSCLPLCL